MTACGRSLLPLLYAAAEAGRAKEIERLLSTGVTVDERVERGFTALMIASAMGHVDAVESLLRAGADPNARADDSTSALLLATHGRHSAVIRRLLASGADPRAADDRGHGPAHEAVYENHAAALELLLDAGADANTIGSFGRTPLHEAARLGYADLVGLLLRRGADADRVSEDPLRWTAWCFAKQGGHGKALKVLRAAGHAQRHASEPRRPRMHAFAGVTWVQKRIAYALSPQVVEFDIRIRALPGQGRQNLVLEVRAALALIQSVAPVELHRIRRHLAGVWIAGPYWAPAFYDSATRTCVLAPNYLTSGTSLQATIAAAIVHEAAHARLSRLGDPADDFVRARIERMCLEAERAFVAKLPQSERLLVLESQIRADPVIWTVHAARVKNAQFLERSGVPRWLARMLSGGSKGA